MPFDPPASGMIARSVAGAARLARRAAQLPPNAHRSVIRPGHRPTLDRAEELCNGLGISMTSGTKKNPEHCAIMADEQTEDWEIVGVVVRSMIGPPR